MMSCRRSPDPRCFPHAPICIDDNGSAYELHGKDDAPVVVLIHGIGLTRWMWRTIALRLAERFRILVYDLWGHGESRACEHAPDLSMLSEQLRCLLDALSIPKAALVGFSLGGMINRRFAMDFPMRVTALAILNSPHERTPDEQALVESRAAQPQSIEAGIDATLARWFTNEFVRERGDVVAQVRNRVLSNNPKQYAAYRRLLASGVLELVRPCPQISKPSLVMTCARDSGSTPDMSCAIAREIVDSQLIVVPDLRHLGLLQEPDCFAIPLESFLSKSLCCVSKE